MNNDRASVLTSMYTHTHTCRGNWLLKAKVSMDFKYSEFKNNIRRAQRIKGILNGIIGPIQKTSHMVLTLF